MQTARLLVLSGELVCVLCSGTLKVHGCYRRHCRNEDGERQYGWVAQGHCESCGKYPAFIPQFLMPYKHYRTEVIERVIAESENGVAVEHLGGYSADVSTMRRWISQFKERGARGVGWLISILATLFEVHIASLKLQGRTLLKQLSRLLSEYPSLGGSGVIGKVNIILTTQNRGFL